MNPGKNIHLVSVKLFYLFIGIFWFSFRLSGQESPVRLSESIYRYGGIERLDTTRKVIFLTFTGGDFGEGTGKVRRVLRQEAVPASFFFTGDFYRNKFNANAIKGLIRDGHYLGAHSDQHLLYAAWENRDSLLVNRKEFEADLLNNYQEMQKFGLSIKDAPLFMPPYEWYNDSISAWTRDLGLHLINFTPGTRSNADYTTPDMGNRYVDSETIMKSIFQYEKKDPSGLNGFILLLHVGTDSRRTDKFYNRLRELIAGLRGRGYEFQSLKEVK
jgi:endoglucanase